VSALEPLGAAARQAALLGSAEHRPWPLPDRRWRLALTLEDVLVAHWRADPEHVAALLPRGVDVDRFDDRAWVGVLALRVSALRLRGTLPIPRISSFLQVNVRTYVRAAGRPAIWFLSLDASSRLAVEAARLLYRVPYFVARVESRRDGEELAYELAREGDEARVYSARAAAAGAVFEPAPGSREAFLFERFALLAPRRRGLLRAEIHHARWRLRCAEGAVDLNRLVPDELELEGEALLHVAERQDVLIWPPESLRL
jgi:uncharacterized protein YqjF (DUF2071 family)